jgi:hypothetical protein
MGKVLEAGHSARIGGQNGRSLLWIQKHQKHSTSSFALPLPAMTRKHVKPVVPKQLLDGQELQGKGKPADVFSTGSLKAYPSE